MSDDDKVTVGLSACSAQDAAAVLEALGDTFETNWRRGEPPPEAAPGHPQVWVATVDTAHPAGAAHPPALGASVTADLQGGYLAVDRVRDALADTYTVREEGTAAGDQEKDVRLRLTN
ncbi:hypothetical protein SRB5_47370 [Streptomyces sp. RB5]|uniref:Uncharacterized protein n=1 Tax=Streptomyces smaragdinus TaxID=2585196 RepID=A0A7K0CM54_9ACTN|nr:hypothetical protein [Streptomyces smaragdinus]MQY14569.1 hypothetical protein [Streptomyces smaragdinus]